MVDRIEDICLIYDMIDLFLLNDHKFFHNFDSIIFAIKFRFSKFNFSK